MIDTSTHKKLYVSTEGSAGPYIMVPLTQLAALKQILDANQVCYEVDDDAISLGDEPFIAVVNLGRDADVAATQALLDSQG